jgi:hypothetical protein
VYVHFLKKTEGKEVNRIEESLKAASRVRHIHSKKKLETYLVLVEVENPLQGIVTSNSEKIIRIQLPP